jgi:hypothetical protein
MLKEKNIETLYTELTGDDAEHIDQDLFARWVMSCMDLATEYLVVFLEYDFGDVMPDFCGIKLPPVSFNMKKEDFGSDYDDKLELAMSRLRDYIRRTCETDECGTVRIKDIFDGTYNPYTGGFGNGIEYQIDIVDSYISSLKQKINMLEEHGFPTELLENKLKKAESYYELLMKLNESGSAIEIERGIERARELVLAYLARWNAKMAKIDI